MTRTIAGEGHASSVNSVHPQNSCTNLQKYIFSGLNGWRGMCPITSNLNRLLPCVSSRVVTGTLQQEKSGWVPWDWIQQIHWQSCPFVSLFRDFLQVLCWSLRQNSVHQQKFRKISSNESRFHKTQKLRGERFFFIVSFSSEKNIVSAVDIHFPCGRCCHFVYFADRLHLYFRRMNNPQAKFEW